MLNTYEDFRSVNGKRQLLIADDEALNREILGFVLSQDYDLVYAANGEEALAMIRERSDTLSLVLLDLMMPGINGLELLRIKRSETAIREIPVIVVTADQKAEVESLRLGAIDFIPKPYPQADVILARVQRTIELFEDRETILSTERDPLTGLYSREYFYRYARQYDQHQRERPMDAIVLDINHFHMINERFGAPYGDAVLRHIGEKLVGMVRDTGGLVCRLEADTFMVYCPHGRDYREILEIASQRLSGDESLSNRVRLRMGVYENVDKSIDVERRFDRAKNAAGTVRGSYHNVIGFYDDTLHEKELFHAQLIEDFPAAIEQRQFEVWFQPKFDVRSPVPRLASAEALVRWRHPKHGLVSPGVFIPLFEANGLIEALDKYVWRETARQMREWKERLGFRVPVSVNMSRIDMLDSDLIDGLEALLREYGLEARELLLEITESAYTQDSGQIIETVKRMRDLGFRVEMDDFGTGYSSLNMISSLPIDALKLDMQFVRAAFRDGGDTRMLEVIIEIADYLSVPVIAEGVETREQLDALRAMGCDLVQGYYFSKPLPAAEFDRFLIARRDTAAKAPSEEAPQEADSFTPDFTGLARALSRDIESIYYVDTETDRYWGYFSDGDYGLLEMDADGTDFFGDCQRDIQKVVYSEDWEKVASALNKQTLLAALAERQSFSMDYRLVVGDRPQYYRMKVIPAEIGQMHHIIVGVSNVDAQITEEQRLAAERQNLMSVYRISQALSRDFLNIYYVDVETDYFVEFSADSDFDTIGIEKRGEDFFSLSRRNFPRFVHPDDIPDFLKIFTKENVLREIDAHGSLSYSYRMMLGEKPIYVMMKAARLDKSHIVIGTSDINDDVLRQRAAVVRSSVAQALSADYFLIFYVDLQTGRYLTYHSDKEETDLDVERIGEDYFSASRRAFFSSVSAEDQAKVDAVLDKEQLLSLLDETDTYTLEFSMVYRGALTYIHMKITRMSDRSDPHIVIGLRNIDARVRQEKAQALALQQATELACRDALTGVKTKRVFVDDELMWDGRIAEGFSAGFAVAVFDLNGLKNVNDTLGHAAGDDYIRMASAAICGVFQHSPVYRIGGDEFAAILTGADYARREKLKARFRKANKARAAEGAVVVACGMSDFIPGKDKRLQDVFERADADMYENKKNLKTIG